MIDDISDSTWVCMQLRCYCINSHSVVFVVVVIVVVLLLLLFQEYDKSYKYIGGTDMSQSMMSYPGTLSMVVLTIGTVALIIVQSLSRCALVQIHHWSGVCKLDNP